MTYKIIEAIITISVVVLVQFIAANDARDEICKQAAAAHVADKIAACGVRP